MNKRTTIAGLAALLAAGLLVVGCSESVAPGGSAFRRPVFDVGGDQMIDSSGVKFPAYFLSADIIASSGEAVPGTWITTEITKPGLIFSVSPQAKKYSIPRMPMAKC